MNHCAIERNGIPSFQEMRNSVSSVTTSISMSGRKESVVCPKPRRMRSYLNHAVNDPARSLRFHFSYHAEHADSEAGIELLDIILAKVWVLDDPMAGAIRLFPEDRTARMQISRQDDDFLFNKFLRATGQFQYFNSTASSGEGIIRDNKRTVPSCPDPLHNK